MNSKSTAVSYALAVLAGVCFVTGVSLLVTEGSVANHGACEKTAVHS